MKENWKEIEHVPDIRNTNPKLIEKIVDLNNQLILQMKSALKDGFINEKLDPFELINAINLSLKSFGQLKPGEFENSFPHLQIEGKHGIFKISYLYMQHFGGSISGIVTKYESDITNLINEAEFDSLLGTSLIERQLAMVLEVEVELGDFLINCVSARYASLIVLEKQILDIVGNKPFVTSNPEEKMSIYERIKESCINTFSINDFPQYHEQYIDAVEVEIYLRQKQMTNTVSVVLFNLVISILVNMDAGKFDSTRALLPLFSTTFMILSSNFGPNFNESLTRRIITNCASTFKIRGDILDTQLNATADQVDPINTDE